MSFRASPMLLMLLLSAVCQNEKCMGEMEKPEREKNKEWLPSTISMKKMATFIARRTILSLNLATFSSKSRSIPVVNRCVCLPYKHYQLVRQCSSIKEGNIPQNQEASPDLELSDSCVKVRLSNLHAV